LRPFPDGDEKQEDLVKQKVRWLVLSGLILGLPLIMIADSVAVSFEAYNLGTVNGQDGWVSLGSIGSGCAVYDHAVYSNSGAPASFGAQSLRISNAATSGCFGDQTFSKPLVNEAGEASATNGGLSGGVRQRHIDVQWDNASVVPTALQPGLHYSASPDRGDGARMSYLRVEDNPLGVDVFFDDVQGTVPFDGVNCFTPVCGNFVETQVATLDRSRPHTFGLSMDFVDGPSNDVVRVYIDGSLVHTGTSWEDYFRFDPEASLDPNTHTVDSLLLRTSGSAAPLTFGKGFLLDNFRLNSGPILIGPPTSKDQCKNGGWQTFNNPKFKNQGQCVDFVEEHKHDRDNDHDSQGHPNRDRDEHNSPR
jgi:hypothetical protein